MRNIIGLVACLLLVSCSSNDAAENTMNVDENLAVENVLNGLPATDTGPDPSEIIHCRRVMRDVSRADCDLYERAWNNLAEGSGAIAAPPTLVRGESAKVSFAIAATDEGGPETGEPTATELLGENATQTVTVRVGAKMGAQLTGEGFAIAPREVVEQELSVTRGARWEWEVTALKAPRHRLLLHVFVRFKDPDGEKSRLLRSEPIPIEVKVTTSQTIGDYMDESQAWLGRGTNWLKALAAFIVALGAVVLAVRKLKSRDGDKQD
jgi:hypothetical protein